LTTPTARSAISTRRALEDRNENSLAEFSVDVAIDPSAAHRLVIGGLPDSRVGLLLSLLVLALGLAAAAVVQVSRERALAQLREDFVTRVSHELRTPVARIRMFAETLLLDRLRTDDERRRSLEAIDRGSRRLAHLIENVMQFSHQRSRSRVASLTEPTDLRALAADVIEEFEAMTDAMAAIAATSAMNATSVTSAIDATHVTRVTDAILGVASGAASGAALAEVDRESFRQILVNLLDNAAKYAGRAGCIRVEIETAGERVQLRVIDRGPGIPARDRERVWLPYVRLDRDRRSAIAGAGIGLAVVQDLLTRDGGRCWIEDTPGGGATIVVTFAAAQASRTAHGDERRGDAGRMTREA
jgi:signal transduction histidine kinase